MLAGGGQERVLIDPQRPHPTNPATAIHKWSAVPHDRDPGGVPSHPILVGHRRHRPAQLTYLATHLHPGPQRQDPTRRSPRSAPSTSCAHSPPGDSAISAWRSPAGLAGQSNDSRAGGPRHGPEPGPAGTRRTERLRLGRFHPDDDFADAFFDLEHPQTRQSQHLLGQPDTVVHVRDLPRRQPSNSRNDGEVPDLSGGYSAPSPRPPLPTHSGRPIKAHLSQPEPIVPLRPTWPWHPAATSLVRSEAAAPASRRHGAAERCLIWVGHAAQWSAEAAGQR